MFFICRYYSSIDYWILCKFRDTESLAIPMGAKQENGNLGKIVPVTDQVPFDMCVCVKGTTDKRMNSRKEIESNYKRNGTQLTLNF